VEKVNEVNEVNEVIPLTLTLSPAGAEGPQRSEKSEP